MAQIIQAGEFATEGEQRAADILRTLPNDWVVICNKTLVARNARAFEIDFIVLGNHLVFVIDEKSWRGRIHGTDQAWVRADGSSERSPLGKVNDVARVLAGELRYQVPHLRDLTAHFVHAAVLLSLTDERPNIRDPRAPDGVLLAASVVDNLIRIDGLARHEAIAPFRPNIQQVLVDLRDRPRFPKAINDYKIDEILSSRPGLYIARATHELMGERRLYVYKLAGVTEEERAFYLREIDAIRQLPPDLVPDVRDPFTWSEDFLVVPFGVTAGKALGTLTAPKNLAELEAELSLACLAFRGLATLHENGVIHRALSPDNVIIKGDGREPRGISFAGFYAARIDGPASVAARLDAMDIEDPYAAPELALSYGLADADSDVYSLSFVFLERLTDVRSSELRDPERTAQIHELLTERWTELPAYSHGARRVLHQCAFRGPHGAQWRGAATSHRVPGHGKAQCNPARPPTHTSRSRGRGVRATG